MGKRAKRLSKGIESLKLEIEKHFKKVEDDLAEGNMERGRYHVKEIDRGLLKALEIKMEILGLPTDLLDQYRERLEEIKRRMKE